MKKRIGFVSNSSSTNFILGIKGDLPVDEIVEKIFKVGRDSLFFNFAKECTEILFNFKHSKTWKESIAVRDYLRRHPKEAKRYEEIKRKGVKISKGEGKKYRKHKHDYLQKLIKKALKFYTKFYK